VGDHVGHEEVVVAVEARGGQLTIGALVEHDGDAEPLGLRPDRVVHGILEGDTGQRVRPQVDALEAEVRHAAAHLGHRGLHVAQRDHADADQPRAIGGQVLLVQPVVVGTADRRVELGVARVHGVEAEGRERHRDVDTVGVHGLEPRLRPHDVF
jgi:hypothetical protein